MGSTLAAWSGAVASSETPEQADSTSAPRPAAINRTIHLLLCFVGLTRPLLYTGARSRRRPSVSVHRGLIGGPAWAIHGSVSICLVGRSPRGLLAHRRRLDAGPAMQQLELGCHRRRRL